MKKLAILLVALAATVCYAGVQPAGGEYTVSMPTSGDSTIVVGTSAWPFPCPAWHGNDQYSFDDEAGTIRRDGPGGSYDSWEFVPPSTIVHVVQPQVGPPSTETGSYEQKP